MKALILVAAVAALFGSTAFGYAGAQQAQNPLHIEYAGSTAQPYTVFVDSGGKYTVNQDYSWVRDEMSRYNLVSYSIDGGSYVDVPRKARGNFLLDIHMDSAHTVTFQAVVQYPVSAVTDSENLGVAFSPPSPTGDDWFDAGSEVMITVSSIEQDGARQQIVSWSIDKSAKQFEGDGTATFTTPAIGVTASHEIRFTSKTQYYVDVISAHGTAVGEGWYDAGSRATISASPAEDMLILHAFAGWDDGSGMQLEGDSVFVVVDSPKILTAKWTTDYSRLAGAAAAPVAVGAVILLMKRKATKGTSSVTATTPATYEFQQQVATSTPLLSLQQQRVAETAASTDDGSNYSKEIMEYALQKALEKLDALHSSGLVSDAKFSKVKEKLEQVFD